MREGPFIRVSQRRAAITADRSVVSARSLRICPSTALDRCIYGESVSGRVAKKFAESLVTEIEAQK